MQSGTAIEILAECSVYGEALADPQTQNLRGKIYQHYDEAGVATNVSFDFKGNLTASSRQLAIQYQQPVDWSVLATLIDPAQIAAAAAPLLQTETFTASSTFDALNRLVTSTAPDGSVAQPIFNEANQLDQMNVNLRGAATATAFVTGIDYNARGQRLAITYGNGAQTSYTYDPETFRLTELQTTRDSDHADLQDLNYVYDPVGNITSINDAAQQTIYYGNQIVNASFNYTYDAIYRLTSATGREHIGQISQPQPDWDNLPRMNQPLPLPNDAQAMRNYTEIYSYDPVGNIQKIVHQAAKVNWTRSYAYDEPNLSPTNNRLTSTTVGSVREAYTYDVHGNMTQMLNLPLMTSDFKDQLASTQQQVVTSGTSPLIYYVYDASGQRVRKVTQSSAGARIKERIYLGGYEVYREYGSDGSTVALERQTLHVMDGTHRIAMAETKSVDTSVPTGVVPIPILRFQLGNHLDSVCLELDGNAAIISYEEYYPYGSTSFQAVSSSIEVSAKRYRYTGKERDVETGLYYYGARYYASWLGRWASCDPVGLNDGSNPYVYSRNNPLRLVDRTGLQSSSPDLNVVTADAYHSEAPLITGESHGPPLAGAGSGAPTAEPMQQVEVHGTGPQAQSPEPSGPELGVMHVPEIVIYGRTEERIAAQIQAKIGVDPHELALQAYGPINMSMHELEDRLYAVGALQPPLPPLADFPVFAEAYEADPYLAGKFDLVPIIGPEKQVAQRQAIGERALARSVAEGFLHAAGAVAAAAVVPKPVATPVPQAPPTAANPASEYADGTFSLTDIGWPTGPFQYEAGVSGLRGTVVTPFSRSAYASNRALANRANAATRRLEGYWT